MLFLDEEIFIIGAIRARGSANKEKIVIILIFPAPGGESPKGDRRSQNDIAEIKDRSNLYF